MAASSSQSRGEEPMGEETSPFEPEYDTEVKETFHCRSDAFNKLMTDPSTSSVHLGSFEWAKIPFELRLERLADVTDESHKDLLAHIDVHRESPDPHWRCTFAASVRTKMDVNHICRKSESDCAICNAWEESALVTCKADKNAKAFIVPLMRLREDAERAIGIKVEIKIEISSWAGVFPRPILSFSDKSDITDVTLIVDGCPIYVTRAILAMRSKFFHGLFYNKKFLDHAKEEIELKDVEFGDVCTFLRLIYPTELPENPIRIANMSSLEAMLELADRWDCPYVSKQMERYLLNELELADTDGFTTGRCLYLADKYRLSTACTVLIKKIGSDQKQLQEFGETPEYKEVSDSLCRGLLDTVMKSEETRVKARRRWDTDSDEFAPSISLCSRKRAVHQPASINSASSNQVVHRPVATQPPIQASSSSSSTSYSALTAPIYLRPTIARKTAPSSGCAPPPTHAEFHSDVVDAIHHAVRSLSSNDSSELLRVLGRLRDMSAREYAALPESERRSLHGDIYSFLHTDRSGRLLDAAIEALVVRVSSLPRTSSTTRKRARAIQD